MSHGIQYLRCTIRHNANGEVVTIRFLIKASAEYNFHYFIAVCAQRKDDESDLVEFSHLDRAYNDVNAIRLAKLRGTVVDGAMYQDLYRRKIHKAVSNFFYLNDHFAPASLEELVGERDMNLDDADTISSLNLSQCSADIEYTLHNEMVKNLLRDLGITPDHQHREMINGEEPDKVLNSEITYRMLIAKYPDAKDEINTRRLAIWNERMSLLRDKVTVNS